MAMRDSLEDDLVMHSMKIRGEEILRCPKCRNVILDDVPSCQKCGTKFGRLAPQPMSAKKWVVIGALLVLAGILGSMVLPML